MRATPSRLPKTGSTISWALLFTLDCSMSTCSPCFLVLLSRGGGHPARTMTRPSSSRFASGPTPGRATRSEVKWSAERVSMERGRWLAPFQIFQRLPGSTRLRWSLLNCDERRWRRAQARSHEPQPTTRPGRLLLGSGRSMHGSGPCRGVLEGRNLQPGGRLLSWGSQVRPRQQREPIRNHAPSGIRSRRRRPDASGLRRPGIRTASGASETCGRDVERPPGYDRELHAERQTRYKSRQGGLRDVGGNTASRASFLRRVHPPARTRALRFRP